MNLDPGSMTLLNLLCTLASAAVAIFVVFRDSAWRRGGLAKQLSDRIDAAQHAADNWFESHHGRELRRKVEAHGDKLIAHAGTLEGVATKADVRRVEGLVGRVEDAAKGAKDGVDRIEGMLMKKALNAS